MEKFRRREMKFSFAAATAANNLKESSSCGAMTTDRTRITSSSQNSNHLKNDRDEVPASNAWKNCKILYQAATASYSLLQNSAAKPI